MCWNNALTLGHCTRPHTGTHPLRTRAVARGRRAPRCRTGGHTRTHVLPTRTRASRALGTCHVRRPDHGQRRPHRHLHTDADQDLLEHALLEGLDLDGGLSGVHDGHDLPTTHRLTGLHEPLHDRADVHVRTQ